MLELETAKPIEIESRNSAQIQAHSNWKINLSALAETQKQLAISLANLNVQVDWIFARDGALSALENGKWWGGCSVPAKAAKELLRTLQITSSVACFLFPSHPTQISYALQRLRSEQAIIALFPRLEDLFLTLHCHDFSNDITGHRLWFIAGDHWPSQISDLFRRNPGLPLPQQFIRTALLCDDASAPLIAAAQKVFNDELYHRSQLLTQLRETRSRPTVSTRKRITIAAPMRFRLWDDCGGVLEALAESHQDFDCTPINFDDPLHASPLALAHAAAESDAVVTANITRADCSHYLHPQIPLISWLTTRAIPHFNTAAAHDALLLTNPQSIAHAKKSGWPANRLALVPWPTITTPTEPTHLSIIADTHPIQPSPGFELSSHQLLWDLIHAELRDNPTLINNDVLAFLRSRMQRLGILEHGLDIRRFIEELIIPAYQQFIAAQLIDSHLPLRIFGQGWREISTFSCHSEGPVTSRDHLKRALTTTLALIHLGPTNIPHPIDTAGPPVIRLTSRGISGIISDCRLAVSHRLKPGGRVTDSTDMVSIARTLRALLEN